MTEGIHCLLTDDPAEARELASRLAQLNADRRQLESRMQLEALAQLDAKVASFDGDMPAGICVYDVSWHQGVVGLVASRIKERLHRPVIAFAPAEPPGWIKGSARSVPGVHVRDVLDAVATRHPGLLEKFGGHAMAAGLTLRASDLPAFEHAFGKEVARWVDEDMLSGDLHTDGELQPGEFNVETAAALIDLNQHEGAHPRFGAANAVTLGRGVLTALVGALVVAPAAIGVAAFATAAGTLAVALDGVDGRLARRQGLASEFGARFDMETDALLVLALAALAWRWDRAGAWVLLSGLLRYAFVAAGWLAAWLRRPLPPSRRRQAVCVVQIAVLLAVVAPVLPPGASAPLALAGLLVLAWSFAVDVTWLAGQARGPLVR